MTEFDIGIIGALEDEVATLISMLSSHGTELISGVEFHTGTIFDKRVVIARCGVGKVFAAICAEAMIIRYSPRLVVNSGVGGALDAALRPLDIVFASSLVQHDMDTSPLGDPVGLISGINKIYFDTDTPARKILVAAAEQIGVRYSVGTVASGDRFIARREDKRLLIDRFDAVCCEMEGGAIAHTAYVNKTPFVVIRAISDSADGDASMDYMEFLPRAAEISTKLTLELIRNY